MIKALNRICMDTNVSVRLLLFCIKTKDTVNKNTKTAESNRKTSTKHIQREAVEV